MRKVLAFLVLLMLPWAARGQALAEWYYWFDIDDKPHEIGYVTNQQFQLQTDVSHLNRGFHTLFVQVKDTAGVYCTPYSQMFYNMPANENHSLLLRYWFDNSGDINELSYEKSQYLLDVSHLLPGFHFLHYYLSDSSGATTDIQSTGFYCTPMASRQKLYYWLAGDSAATQIPDFKGGFVLDVTKAYEGFNTIYFLMENNGLSVMQPYNFIKVPQTENTDDMTLVCIIDGEVVGEEKVSAHGGMVKCEMDVSKIPTGVHKAMFQLITPSGVGSSIAETYFIRTLTNNDVASMQCSYTIDGYLHRTEKGTCANGVFHFELPVNEIEDGLHRIDYMLVAENGATTTQGNAWFFKTPIGGNGIIQYDYWLNDKNDEMQSVTLDEPMDPFQLIKLLPVTSEPIRSTAFLFEVKDGKPMLHAKNDIHFRFHDITGRWVDESKQYVDYNTTEVLTDIPELESTQTFPRPDENGIKWFKFEAEYGDSIALKSNQATCIQVLDATGKELYSAAGSKSVNYGGCHLFEDGTFYVAVHDVTGSKTEMTLDYQHIDKYAILSYDVHTVGNGGCSTITFDGNGFNDLYAVDLYTSNGDTIHSIDIGHESNANTTVLFDFSYFTLGQYDAVFHFTLEDRFVSNAIVVEESKEIELTLKVDCPSTFLRGTESEYTITVTNNGNSTAYCVPVQVNITAEKLSDILSIKAERNEIESSSILDILKIDSLDDATIDVLKEYEEQLNGTECFFTLKDENGDDYYWDEFFINIPPSSTVSINLSILSNSSINCYAMISTDWLTLNTVDKPSYIPEYKAITRSSLGNAICCYKEQIKCALDIIDNAIGFGPNAIAGCISSIVNTASQMALDVGCGEGDNIADKLKNLNRGSLSQNIIGSAVSCITVKYDALIKPISDRIRKFKLQKEQFTRFRDIAENQMKDKTKLRQEFLAKAENSRNQGNLIEANEYLKKADETDLDIKYWENEMELQTKKVSDASHEMFLASVELSDMRSNFALLLDGVKTLLGVKAAAQCIISIKDAISKPGCPSDPQIDGGTSTPRNSCEPNDIRGYTSASGSTFMRNDVEDVTFIIDSENDSVFADAPAHTVIITDTINGRYYDLASLSMRNITIGDVSMDIDGTEQNFIKTMDLRPRINVIAQVEQIYDPDTGIVKWIWTSLDPMTMEPTDDVMQGVLPVNDESHIGEGHVTYCLKQKTGLPDGTEVTNQADIIFDANKPVYTPVWTNIIDAIAPTSMVSNIVVLNDSVFELSFNGEDNRSGIWKYTLYVQDGLSAPWREVATDIAPDSVYTFKGFDCIDYGFCVLATDSAGNEEYKELKAEAKKYALLLGDANNDGVVNVTDLNSTVNYIYEQPSERFKTEAADVDINGSIDIADLNGIADIIMTGETNELYVSKSSIIADSIQSLETLFLDDIYSNPDDAVYVDICLDNSIDVSSIQFDLKVPEGVSVINKQNSVYDVELSDRATSSHSVAGAYRNPDCFRVVAFSTDGSNFTDNSGELIRIGLKVDATIADGYHSVVLSNIILGTSDEQSLYVQDTSSVIIVKNPMFIGDIVSDDEIDAGFNLSGKKRQRYEKGIKVTKNRKFLVR